MGRGKKLSDLKFFKIDIYLKESKNISDNSKFIFISPFVIYNYIKNPKKYGENCSS